MLRFVGAISLLVAAPVRSGVAQTSRTAADNGSCVIVAFGSWLPEAPSWLPVAWRRVAPAIQLARGPREVSIQRDWSPVAPAPTLKADTTWAANTAGLDPRYRWHVSDLISLWYQRGKSIEFLRPAAIDYGFYVRAQWHGDTLRGRAHSFSDFVMPESEPRANVVGMRYHCDAAAEARAHAVVNRMLELERPDRSVDAVERARQRAGDDQLSGPARQRNR